MSVWIENWRKRGGMESAQEIEAVVEEDEEDEESEAEPTNPFAGFRWPWQKVSAICRSTSFRNIT